MIAIHFRVWLLEPLGLALIPIIFIGIPHSLESNAQISTFGSLQARFMLLQRGDKHRIYNKNLVIQGSSSMEEVGRMQGDKCNGTLENNGGADFRSKSQSCHSIMPNLFIHLCPYYKYRCCKANEEYDGNIMYR